jgi:hypothetical protein
MAVILHRRTLVAVELVLRAVVAGTEAFRVAVLSESDPMGEP